MIDRKYIRQDVLSLKKALQRRGESPELADRVNEVFKQLIDIKKQSDSLRQQRNEKSKQVGLNKRNGLDTEDIMQELKVLSEKIKDAEVREKELDTALKTVLYTIPNIPHASVPDGEDEKDNVVIKEVDGVKSLLENPKPHYEIGEKLDILLLKTGSMLSGSRFTFLKGQGAKLERALLSFFLEENEKRGYTEIMPPYLVREDILYGSGQLPKFRDELYKTEPDNLYLIPTAEVPLANMYRDKIINESELPLKFMAYTPCFRREAGSYGKDVRGMVRLHQFNKVELFKYTLPENSYDELESMRADAEALLRKLGLKYRVVSLCAGDLGFSAAKTYDLEVYSPGIKKWLEVSSISNTEDFQARRTMTRVRRKNGKTEYVHTLNGSGLATPRIFVAILEHYQTEDGRIAIPEVLKKYMENREFIS